MKNTFDNIFDIVLNDRSVMVINFWVYPLNAWAHPYRISDGLLSFTMDASDAVDRQVSADLSAPADSAAAPTSLLLRLLTGRVLHCLCDHRDE